MSEENASVEVESDVAEVATETQENDGAEGATIDADGTVDVNIDGGDEELALSEGEVDEVKDAIEDGASAEEVKEMIETFKFKANGKDQEVTLDWNDKEDIIRRLQMAEAAQPAMQKASENEKLLQEFLSDAKTKPWDVLKELGLDPDELSEQRIQDRIEQMKKTPEEVEKEEMAAELNALRDKVKKEEEARKDAEMQKVQKETEVELENQIMGAIDATQNLPKSPYVVKRVADAMLFAMDNGYPDVSADQVLPMVEKELEKEVQQMFEGMPDKILEQFIGQKTNERLRQNRLKKMKKAPTKKVEEIKKQEVKKEETKKKISLKEFLGSR